MQELAGTVQFSLKIEKMNKKEKTLAPALSHQSVFFLPC
jgi:hypothetical protein